MYKVKENMNCKCSDAFSAGWMLQGNENMIYTEGGMASGTEQWEPPVRKTPHGTPAREDPGRVSIKSGRGLIYSPELRANSEQGSSIDSSE